MSNAWPYCLQSCLLVSFITFSISLLSFNLCLSHAGSNFRYQSITSQPPHNSKSFEELRHSHLNRTSPSSPPSSHPHHPHPSTSDGSLTSRRAAILELLLTTKEIQPTVRKLVRTNLTLPLFQRSCAYISIILCDSFFDLSPFLPLLSSAARTHLATPPSCLPSATRTSVQPSGYSTTSRHTSPASRTLTPRTLTLPISRTLTPQLASHLSSVVAPKALQIPPLLALTCSSKVLYLHPVLTASRHCRLSWLVSLRSTTAKPWRSTCRASLSLTLLSSCSSSFRHATLLLTRWRCSRLKTHR